MVYVSLDDALLVDKNHDGFLSTGDTLRYTLVVKNTTGQAASALKITTALDRHVALLVGSVVTSAGTVSSGNHAGDTSPTVLLPTLAPGDSIRSLRVPGSMFVRSREGRQQHARRPWPGRRIGLFESRCAAISTSAAETARQAATAVKPAAKRLSTISSHTNY